MGFLGKICAFLELPAVKPRNSRPFVFIRGSKPPSESQKARGKWQKSVAKAGMGVKPAVGEQRAGVRRRSPFASFGMFNSLGEG
jgi:hypothetical protein